MGKLLHAALTRSLLDSTVLKTGEVALRRLAEESFDLVLLDIRLPGISGLDVCRWLKADLRLRHIPVIFISSYHDNRMRAQAFVLGAAEYLTKPFSMQHLHACVVRHLALATARQRGEPPLPPTAPA